MCSSLHNVCNVVVITVSNGLTWIYTGTLMATHGFHDDVTNWKYFPRSFDIFFDLRPNKRLSEQSRSRWFVTPLHSLWCPGNVYKCRAMNCRVIIHYVVRCFRIGRWVKTGNCIVICNRVEYAQRFQWPTDHLSVQQLDLANAKENIKVLYYWLFVTGILRWFPVVSPRKGWQQCVKLPHHEAMSVRRMVSLQWCRH